VHKASCNKENLLLTSIQDNTINYRNLGLCNKDDLGFKLLTHPMAFSLFQNNNFIMHASAVMIENKAIMFVGPSTSGKSSTAASLLNKGNFITEDIARIVFEDQVKIFHGPPIIKLNKSFLLDEIDYIRSFEISADARSRKGYVLDKEITKEAIPISACFILKKSNNNQINEISPIQKFKSILFNSFCSIPRNSCEISEKNLYKKIELFIRDVPIYELEKKLDKENEFIKYFLDHKIC
jgi:hypothetical protein